jgi:Zn-dependent M28 family amino/carboxypeptidase
MKQGKLIRFLVVALPAGLMLIGTGVMIRTEFSEESEPLDPNLEVRLEVASLNRRPVSREDLERDLRTLTETIGERHVGKPEKLEQAAIWIESTLGGGNIGYQVERNEYEVSGLSVRNLEATLPGTIRRDEIVVVGAHYDSVPGSPAANDNGTGVVAMLALARAFAGDQQERTVRFVAFVNEEPPFFQTDLMGSRVYAARCRSKKDKIVAMISLETIGYFSDAEGSQEIPPGLEGEFPNRGNFLAFVGNEDSRYIADSARAAFTSASAIPAIAGGFPTGVPGVGWSDQWSFWQEGYPGIMVTDTAPYRYPHYHKPTDTIDKIDLEKLTEVVQGLQAVVKAWANP